MKNTNDPRYPVITEPRTKEEAVLETCYTVRYMLIQQRLFSRMANVFTFTSLFGGSAAFAGVITHSTTLTATSGVFVAISTMLDFVIKPKENAAQCRKARRLFQRLIMKESEYNFEEYDFEFGRIALMDTPNIDSLRRPAVNDTFEQCGQTDQVIPLTRWERFMKMIA
tara:strand:- start:2395 stop:2898 length:504 start_codon:yes stop_codon:yes gene_type:complete